MHYKIALCDDAPADRALLDGLVHRWAEGAGHTIQIAAFESAEQFLFHYAEENDYDILLLDVEMGGMDGVPWPRRSANKMRRCRSSLSPGTRTTSPRGTR